jgi:CheY-like chemotaxis protein
MANVENIQGFNPEAYRILVLDTAEHINRLERACREGGHEIVSVSHIAEGLEFLRRKDKVDVVVSAVHLEGESVFDFLREMKNDPVHCDVPFIMICSEPSEIAVYVNEHIEQAAEVLGADKYLMMDEYDGGRLLREIEASLPDLLPRRFEDPKHAY